VQDGEEEKQKQVYNRDAKVEEEDEEQKLFTVSKEDKFWIESQLQTFVKNQSKAEEIFTILNIQDPGSCELKVRHLVKYYNILKQIEKQDSEEPEHLEKLKRAKEDLYEHIE
jgi:transposase